AEVPLTCRAPQAAPLIRVDRVNLSALHAEFRRQGVGLFPCSTNRHGARRVAMLAQFGSSQLHALDIVDTAVQKPGQDYLEPLCVRQSDFDGSADGIYRDSARALIVVCRIDTDEISLYILVRDALRLQESQGIRYAIIVLLLG